MLITKLKDKEEIIRVFSLKPAVFKCFGCKEVYFPEEEIDSLLTENRANISGIFRLDYFCREEFSEVYTRKYIRKIEDSQSVLVFSCGVGVQVLANISPEKKVLAGCDTYYLDGFQGLTIQNSNCEQCGECYLNGTGGICPITACSKWLLNGQCGGAKNGKCEVSPEMDCGWELIYKRLQKIGRVDILRKNAISSRDYEKIVAGLRKAEE